MRLKKGPWDGAQPREHVLGVLRKHGVQVTSEGDDYYELVDCDGDAVIVAIPQPVLSETIAYLYRRFGELHGFEIIALVRKH